MFNEADAATDIDDVASFVDSEIFEPICHNQSDYAPGLALDYFAVDSGNKFR